MDPPPLPYELKKSQNSPLKAHCKLQSLISKNNRLSMSLLDFTDKVIDKLNEILSVIYLRKIR
jgi:hypothetical protein